MAMETAQEQDLAFERLRLVGDYQHNGDVLALGEGELIVVRKPKKVEGGIAANFLPCPSCMGFFHGLRALEALTVRPLLVPRAPTPPPKKSGQQYSKKLRYYYRQQFCKKPQKKSRRHQTKQHKS